ncbi:hypothetical protein HYV43_01490 [Candidatus Micrarchaeota archaeon]|nr:hypothetical protein [Candidatus Micrarchaeota archaeon]
MAAKNKVRKKSRPLASIGGRQPSGKPKHSKVAKLIRLAKARLKKAAKHLRRK